MNKLEVTIKPEHFVKSVSYASDKNPLEIALNEQYPDIRALVGGTTVITNQGEYKIPTGIWGGKDAKFSPRQIDKLCAESKKSTIEIPTIKFSITQ